jgi:hypothetical protein
MCVGNVFAIKSYPNQILQIKATGRGQYQRTSPSKQGFPRLTRSRQKVHFSFQTGDMVKAVVPKGKHQGNHAGRVAVRKTGSFNVGKTQGISYKHCKLIQKADGYEYL